MLNTIDLSRLLLRIVSILSISSGLNTCSATLTCEEAKNITVICFGRESDLLHRRTMAIQKESLPVISDRVCELCRYFNESEQCLNVLPDACTQEELGNFMWDQRVHYLGTVSTLCKYENILQEIQENDCFRTFTAKHRQCDKGMRLDQNINCSLEIRIHKCATDLASALCDDEFTGKDHLLDLTDIYLRTLAAQLDIHNCRDDSRLPIAQIYPNFLDRERKWKKDELKLWQSSQTASYNQHNKGEKLYANMMTSLLTVILLVNHPP